MRGSSQGTHGCLAGRETVEGMAAAKPEVDTPKRKMMAGRTVAAEGTVGGAANLA